MRCPIPASTGTVGMLAPCCIQHLKGTGWNRLKIDVCPLIHVKPQPAQWDCSHLAKYLITWEGGQGSHGPLLPGLRRTHICLSCSNSSVAINECADALLNLSTEIMSWVVPGHLPAFLLLFSVSMIWGHHLILDMIKKQNTLVFVRSFYLQPHVFYDIQIKFNSWLLTVQFKES